MFKFIGKMISKVIGWGIRKIGGGIEAIGKKLSEYDLDITDESIGSSVISSMREIDMLESYKDVELFDKVPIEKIISTTDNLSRNYLTKLQVHWNYQFDPVPHAEILTVTHDENLSQSQIENRIRNILDDYSQFEQLGNVNLISVERISVFHKEGNPF